MGAVILATRNKGKIAELTRMLEGFQIEVRGLDAFPEIAEVEETGTTFEENARLKAEAVSRATGLVAVADDSGLEVDALGGAPGVFSARYAGDGADDAANNAKLLRELAGEPPEKRTARFRCVMLAAAPNGEELMASGTWEGMIAEAPRGEGGFGYDPVFCDPKLGRAAAELTRDEKNARSHRGKALKALMGSWPEFWARTKG